MTATPPPNAVGGYSPSGMQAVSCASAGNCTAVGRYVDIPRRSQGWLVTETAGTWGSGIQAPLPGDAGTNPAVNFRSVSCVSPGNCTAVGTYVDGTGNTQGLLLTQTSGVWGAAVKAVLPAGAAAAPGVDVRSVSCTAPGTCTAVGTYEDNAGNQQGLLLTQTSGTWAAGERAPLPTDASSQQGVTLDSVSCASAGECVAVGSYREWEPIPGVNMQQGLMITKMSGSWLGPSDRLFVSGGVFSGDPRIALTSVSCAAAGECAAVGRYLDAGGAQQGVVVRQTGSAWGAATPVTLPAGAAGDPKATLTGVSCSGVGDCAAVGTYADSAGTKGLLVGQSSGSWGAGATAPLPAGAATDPKVTLSSVSCATAGACNAVGGYDDGSGRTQGLLLTQASGTWATGNTALPGDASASKPGVALRSVSCPAAGSCAAAGGYLDTSQIEQALVIDKSSGTWGAGVSPPPLATAGKIRSVGLRAVSCVSAGECTAVGSYVDPLGVQGMLLSRTGGTWGTGVAAVAPAGAAPDPQMTLGSVSCPSAGNCATVGSYLDNAHHVQGVLLNQTSGTWAGGVKAVLPAGAAADSGLVLQAVSCGAPGDCAAVGTYADGASATQGVLLSETAGVWASGVKAALPPDAAANPEVVLTSVSCPAAGTCTAVGSYKNSSGDTRALVLSRSGGTWATGTAPSLPAGAAASQVASLNSVSCPAAGSCTAVGTYYDLATPSLSGFAVSQTSGAWGTGTRFALPANASPSEFAFLGSAACQSLGVCAAVSCPSAGNCAAVGNYRDGGSVERPLLINATSGGWGKGIEATPPAGGSMIAAAGLAAVSCGWPGECGAVASFRDGAGAMQGMLLNQTGGTWGSGAAAVLPAGAGTDPLVKLGSVSCVSNGACAAVGSYVDAAGQPLGLLINSPATRDDAPAGSGGGSSGGSGGSPGGGTTPPPSGSTPPAPGKATVGKARVAGPGVSVPVSCTGAAACQIRITLSVTLVLRKGKVVAVTAAKARTTKRKMVVGRTTATIAPGTKRTVRLSLNVVGRALLGKHSPLRVRLVVTAAGRTVSSGKLTFRRAAKGRA